MTTQNETNPSDKGNQPQSPNENDDLLNDTPEMAGDNDITAQEIAILDNAGVKESVEDEDEVLAAAQLDDTDEDGVKLNQTIDLTGDDLDIPGSEADDDNELIGEEDEENNSYSSRDQGDNVE